MAVKLVNLDDVKPAVVKKIALGGVEHEMKVLSVGDVLDDAARQKELNEKAGPSEIFQAMLDTVMRAFPTLPKDQVKVLTMEQMRAIYELILDASVEEAPVAEEGASGN